MMASGPGRRGIPASWAPVALVVVLLGVVALGILGKSVDLGSGSTAEPAIASVPSLAPQPVVAVPDFLLHAWGRPTPITPNTDKWGSGFLRVSPESVEHGPAPGPAASRSKLTAVGIDRLILTATAQTKGCLTGDVGEYRWSIGGKGTVLTLAVVGSDGCADRESALKGPWVRSDFVASDGAEGALSPGTHQTTAFDPLGDSGAPTRLSYTVGPGWEAVEDNPAVFVLHQVPDPASGQASMDAFLFLFGEPRVAADIERGASCAPFSAAPDIGGGVDAILAAIIARPGVASTPPSEVTIDGVEGQVVDLQLAPDWQGGCEAPEGPVVGVPLLVGAGLGQGPTLGIGPDHPIRLVLLDVGRGRTMSIAMVLGEPSEAAKFEAWVNATMPVVEGLRFHDPAP